MTQLVLAQVLSNCSVADNAIGMRKIARWTLQMSARVGCLWIEGPLERQTLGEMLRYCLVPLSLYFRSRKASSR